MRPGSSCGEIPSVPGLGVRLRYDKRTHRHQVGSEVVAVVSSRLEHPEWDVLMEDLGSGVGAAGWSSYGSGGRGVASYRFGCLVTGR